MQLYFARHAESEANVGRVIANRGWSHPLTETGRRQAAELATSLRSELCEAGAGAMPRSRIFSSPLRRAVETAEVVAVALSAPGPRLPLERSPALSEADCGVIEGRSDEAAWGAHDDTEARWLAGDPTARIEGGESLDDLLARFEPWLRSVLEAPDVTVVAVGHGSLFRFVLPAFVVDRQRRPIDPPAIEHADALIVDGQPRDGLVLVGSLSQRAR